MEYMVDQPDNVHDLLSNVFCLIRSYTCFLYVTMTANLLPLVSQNNITVKFEMSVALQVAKLDGP